METDKKGIKEKKGGRGSKGCGCGNYQGYFTLLRLMFSVSLTYILSVRGIM